MFKDKDKQREADRERQRRYRAERGRQAYPKGVTQGVTQGVTDSGRDKEGVTVIPSESHVDASDIGVVKALHQSINKPKRGKDINPYQTDVMNPYQMTVMERLFYRPASELGRGQTNFVSLPGRACYNMFKRKARG